MARDEDMSTNNSPMPMDDQDDHTGYQDLDGEDRDLLGLDKNSEDEL